MLDSTDKERSGLAVRRMKRLLAPAAQENPIFMHLTANPTDTKAVEAAIDQMQEVGFEMIIYSFGSGFQIESSDPGYISKIKASIDYAKSHGNIEVGAYDLIGKCSRSLCVFFRSSKQRLHSVDAQPAEWLVGLDQPGDWWP